MSETFAKRLRGEREAGSWSQTALAKELGLTPVAISGYERDQREPNFETLIKICEIFGVSTDYMLGRTDYPCTPDAILKGQERELSELIRALVGWEDLFKYISGLSQRLTDTEKIQFMDFIKSFGETYLKRKREEIKKPGE